MANVSGVGDPEFSLQRAVVSRPGESIKVRIQPQLQTIDLDYRKQPAYLAWRGVHWVVECRDARECRALKDALKVFFDVVAGTAKIGRLEVALDRLTSKTVESSAR